MFGLIPERDLGAGVSPERPRTIWRKLLNPLEWACLSRISREILRIFHGFKSRSQDIFARQSWLASIIAGRIGHCTREQVNRCIAALARLGFIRKLKRHSRFWTYSLEKYQVISQRTPNVTSRRSASYYLPGRPKTDHYISYKPSGQTQTPFEVPTDPGELADIEEFIRAHEARVPAIWGAQSIPRKPATSQSAQDSRRQATV